ncbi:MAG: hypothetical protein ACP5OA_02685 [Candidatus Woesearchaeota archaeon]
MVKNSRSLTFIFSLVFLMFIPLVLGANVLDEVLAPFKGIDIAKTYSIYFPIIDAILYFVLFIGIAKMALGERFKGSNSVPTMIGVILAIGMAVFESQAKFNLGMLAPFAALIFFLILGMGIYSYTKSVSQNKILPFALGMATMMTLINWLAPSIKTWITKMPFLSTIWNVGILVAYISLMVILIQSIRGWGSTHVRHPTSSETADVDTVFPRTQPFKKKAKEALDVSEELAKDDPFEKDLVMEEKQLENLDEYANVIPAEGVKFAAQTGHLLEGIEKEGEVKEKTMLDAINGYTDEMGKYLSQLDNVTMIDQASRAYLENELKLIMKLCEQIVVNEKNMNIARGDTVKELTKDVMKIDDAIKRISQIDEGLKYIEKNVLKDIDITVIGMMKKKIAEKAGAITKTTNKIANFGKPITEEQTKELQGLIEKKAALNTKMLTDIYTLQHEMDEVTKAMRTLTGELEASILEIRTHLNDVIASEGTLVEKNKVVMDKIKGYNKKIKLLDDLSKQLRKDLDHTVKESENIEEIPINAAMDIASVFEILIKTKLETKELYEKDIAQLIKDVDAVVGNMATLTIPIKNLQTGINNMQNGYGHLMFAAEGVLGKDAVVAQRNGLNKIDVAKKIIEITQYMKNIIEEEERLKNNIVVNTRNALKVNEERVQNEIKTIVTEIENIKTTERSVIQKFEKTLNTLTDRKSKVDEAFKKEAEKFTAKMTETTQDIREKRDQMI